MQLNASGISNPWVGRLVVGIALSVAGILVVIVALGVTSAVMTAAPELTETRMNLMIGGVFSIGMLSLAIRRL